jgi:NADPH:quinone reductase-like Zn-dependent oxidoreductase
MKAIVVTDQAAGTAGMMLADRSMPEPAGNDVLVAVHASGYTPGERQSRSGSDGGCQDGQDACSVAGDAFEGPFDLGDPGQP